MVVAGGLLEPELCAPERCAELGDEFFGAVAAITEPAGQVAMRAVRCGPVQWVCSWALVE